MSVVYQSWEVASGPIMGYSMSIQGNVCATADAVTPEASNYSSNTLLSPESLRKAVATSEVSNGITIPNHKTLTPEDTVICGLSSLSLYPQFQFQAGSPSENCKISPLCQSSNNCNISNERNSYCFAAHSGGYYVQGRVSCPQKSINHDSNSFHSFEYNFCGGSTFLSHPCSSDRQGSPSPSTFRRVATRNLPPLHDNYGNFNSCNFPSVYHRPKHTLDVVVEDKPFEENSMVAVNDNLKLDALSSSSTDSIPSLHDLPNGSVSSGEGLCCIGESEIQSEIQSAYEGPSTFTRDCSPPRKGLSRFYAGKSRSFSCLGDVMSLKDLAKPENPYAKKRRCQVGRAVNLSRPQLPPLQKGAASISKKALHNGKSTLVLAVAMSTKDFAADLEKDDQSFEGGQRNFQRNPLASRSYSLSDLQRATENRVISS